MERQLPLVEIAGTAFYVDVQREELRQKDNAVSRISFNVFEQDGNGYTFLFDKELRCAAENRDTISELGSRYEWITLPALMELDPVGLAIKYDIPIEILSRDIKQKGDVPLQDRQWQDLDQEDEEV